VSIANVRWIILLNLLYLSILFLSPKVEKHLYQILLLLVADAIATSKSKQEGIDPTSSENVPLYHPRQDIWLEQFIWSEDGLEIVGITPTGRATIDALNLNRSGVKNIRRLLVVADLHPPT
jgi:hypothetical protein